MTEKELKDACYHLLAKILANIAKDQFYSAEDNSVALTVALSRWRIFGVKPSTVFSEAMKKELAQDGTMHTNHEQKAQKETESTGTE